MAAMASYQPDAAWTTLVQTSQIERSVADAEWYSKEERTISGLTYQREMITLNGQRAPFARKRNNLGKDIRTLARIGSVVRNGDSGVLGRSIGAAGVRMHVLSEVKDNVHQLRTIQRRRLSLKVPS